MKVFLKIGKWVIICLVAILVIGIVGGALTDKSSQSAETTPAPTPTSTEFTVEHDEEYLATREKIWNFLLDKDYEVQTIVGVPNIGKTDADLGEGYEGWYAFVKFEEEWTEFSIVLFDGEVTAIKPVK